VSAETKQKGYNAVFIDPPIYIVHFDPFFASFFQSIFSKKSQRAEIQGDYFLRSGTNSDRSGINAVGHTAPIPVPSRLMSRQVFSQTGKGEPLRSGMQPPHSELCDNKIQGVTLLLMANS
jgi:hypothetical protein